jgi:teichuronic acid biosynthesis glycosyltransferase TuaG
VLSILEPKMNPRVSVIMPSYNHAEFIGAAIGSVIGQTYSVWELIIVDNYSTDATAEIIRKFDDIRIRYFQFANNGVIAASRNFGVEQSSGTILAFLDSDDIWAENKLEVQVPYLENKSVGAVSSNFLPIGQVKYCKNHLSKTNKNQLYEFTDLIIANPVMTSSLIMRTSDFKALCGFDEHENFVCIEDWELWLRLTHDIGKICVVNLPLLKYRIIRNKNRDLSKIRLNVFNIAQKLQNLAYLSTFQVQLMCNAALLSIAHAYLHNNTKYAGKYYMLALVKGVGLKQKLTAIIGLFLAALPKFLSRNLLELMYSARNILQSFRLVK